MKQSGWMVNLTMRRVEYVVAKESHYNRPDYGCYQGPKRTYMRHDCLIFDTELDAVRRLFDLMSERRTGLVQQLRKYTSELDSVKAALECIQEEG